MEEQLGKWSSTEQLVKEMLGDHGKDECEDVTSQSLTRRRINCRSVTELIVHSANIFTCGK